MRSFDITIDEKYFNLLLRSLTERENELLSNIAQEGEESDLAALISNDLVYLRLCKKDLEECAKNVTFSDNASSLVDEYIDFANM